MTAAEAPWEPAEAYPQLAALAAEMRPDWSRQDLWDALLAVRSAGWAWKDVFREVNRLAWDKEETPATLRNSARRPGTSRQTGPEVNARGLALALAAIEEVKARKTGPLTALTEDGPAQAAS
jgi:hypothetical protein